jgi:glycosyltransferase involved in cell wall biosynthesis
MKVIFSLKSLHHGSITRGIGVYTRELVEALQKHYPKSKFISTTKNPLTLNGDIVHYPYFDPFALTLNLLKKMPVVITIHDLIPLRFPTHFKSGIRGKIKWMIQRYRARLVDHIITDSQASKSDIVKLIGVDPSKVTVIPLGPNKAETVPVRLTRKIAASHKLPEKYLLYVGDINWNKNVPGLIDAFAKIKDPNLYLVLVGKVFSDAPPIAEYRAVESAIRESGKQDKIMKLGFVPTHHLSVIYSLATLYVQPSFYEGFGLPILEAMKFGCPVATSNRGSLPEIGGDAVAYFDPKKDMTEVISRLLKSPAELVSLKEKGLAQSQKFAWKNTAAATYKVYEQVLAHHS